MLVIIIIAVILGIIAGLVSAIFGLDFETVFIWCVLGLCGLGLLFLLNPIFWQGYIRVQRERRARAERLHQELQELRTLEPDEEWDREFDKEIEQEVDEFLKYTPWEYNAFTGEYERNERLTGRQECMPADQYERMERMKRLGL